MLNKKKEKKKAFNTELVKQIKCPTISDFVLKMPPGILEESPYPTNMDYCSTEKDFSRSLCFLHFTADNFILSTLY